MPETGRGASVICYVIARSAIVQLAYDPLPPTAPHAARSPDSVRRFGSGCDPARRRPPHESKTPIHLGNGWPALFAPIVGTRRLRRSRVSDSGRPRTWNG